MKLNFKWISILIISLAVIVSVSTIILKNGDYLIKEAQKETLKQTVEVSGKVIPMEEVDLSFSVSGKVVSNNYKVGDKVSRGSIIAELDKSKILADIAKAQADLEVSRIEVSELSGDQNKNRTENEKRNIVSVLKNTYITADLAVRNKTDQIFTNPDSSSPKATVAINDYSIRQRMSASRADVRIVLKKWNEMIKDLTFQTLSDSDIDMTLNNLDIVNDYLQLIDLGLSDSSPAGEVSQSDLDGYRSNIATARNSISDAIDEVTNLNETLRDVVSDLPIKQAQFDSSQATLNSLRAELDNYTIVAPFNGVITDNDLNVGQTVKANDVLVSMITENDLEIEVFVPEISIANIKIGNPVEFVLDAFGPEKFTGYVASIDPSETLDDGVSTYRVLIALEENESSSQIKSGMTADTSISTLMKEDVIVAPVSAVYTLNGKTYVYVRGEGEIQRREIETGQKDSFGNIEVLRGLEVGDKIILNFEE